MILNPTNYLIHYVRAIGILDCCQFVFNILLSRILIFGSIVSFD